MILHSDLSEAERAMPAPPGGDPVLATYGLTKDFGQRRAVDALSIAIPRGTIAGFVGPNGAGKTTTIRMLLGLVRPTAGAPLLDRL
jgi:ABC-2 type transport system ATP-binding protein